MPMRAAKGNVEEAYRQAQIAVSASAAAGNALGLVKRKVDLLVGAGYQPTLLKSTQLLVNEAIRKHNENHSRMLSIHSGLNEAR